MTMTSIPSTMTSISLSKEDHNDDFTANTKKSHGGRHRIFTEEQRKVRNRLAQAAFRERRSQYTQTLQQTVLDLEKIIQELQESNRNTSVRAEIAEQRCVDLEKQNNLLQQLISTVSAENQRLLEQNPSSSSTSSSPQQSLLQPPPPFISVPASFESESSSITEEEMNKTPIISTLSSPSSLRYQQQHQQQDICKPLTGECSFFHL
ncbi:hypothetical protein BDA99DRAFT_556762 [Phascolomyces articulosus]|uniref:BZIP domain-containing protein n=1 Tax=Phascolomyces articulosus TaxID=60185 RepID=A0AAD5KHU7_9FUNG|nr:hypothetical protein BDA99DRAFT_556762 [Phascolomyces articulosus]